MLQDLDSNKFYNQYEEIQKKDTDLVMCFTNNQILVKIEGTVKFPTIKEWQSRSVLQFLFRIDDIQYYLAMENKHEMEAEYEFVNVRSLRDTAVKKDCFAAATAYHLYQWYRDNQFCGRCGGSLISDVKERMLFCPHCKNMVYPKIAPAVIVGLIHKEQILMTKYAGREYKNYALIAGFTEIGETAEETVRREVMEEVGLKVRDLTYYKSQPWGFDSNLLIGFFARLEGEDTITRDEGELALAQWVPREEAHDMDDGASLTREMMEYYYQKGEKGIFPC